MWLAACSCEVDSVVGEIKAMAGKVSVRSEASNMAQMGYLQMCLVISGRGTLGPNDTIHAATKP